MKTYRGNKKMTLADRRAQVYDKCIGTEDPQGCWTWIGTSGPHYGHLTVMGRTVSSHKQAWILERGPVLAGLVIRHTCHNKKCCNVAHMVLGTAKDNYDDMIRAGRQNNPHGSMFSQAKLTEDDVPEIRREYSAGGISQRALGAKYGVTQMVISRIVRGVGWKHVEEP